MILAIVLEPYLNFDANSRFDQMAEFDGDETHSFRGNR